MTEENKVPRRAGRPPGAPNKIPSPQSKYKDVLKRFSPLLDKALKKAESILDAPLDSKTVTSTTQLAAVKMIVDRNLELLEIVYGKQEGDEDDFKVEAKPDAVPTQARFSTKVIPIKGD
jgi:hypothetical protein